ncbi:helix-turn-helix domain-containing protein [Clostridium sp. MCC353]|uniref:helix-turn-helix transcriptional regulator n=1 Tax=Clostridium sp. MCC353 TaxID=2592646 RepID=UPI001C010393|nr:helix-turn-helix domain-containing protein [Clostridium sp. MCC353]
MVADRIKDLREKNELTQTALAKKLNVTRSSVNAWEMGTSVPSTALIVDIAKLFHISTDYLLGIKETSTLDISYLNEKETMLVYSMVEYFKSLKSPYS